MVEVMKIMVTSFQWSYACTATLSAPNPAAGHLQSMPPLETPGPSQASLGRSLLGVTAPFSWVPVHTSFCLCPPRVYFPVLCKFWQLYGDVNDDLLQESLCHTQVCCTKSPCPCSSPLLTRTSTGDAQTQFCLSLCGVPGSWRAQGLFEPSERLWREWSLILNANLLPSHHLAWAFPLLLGIGYLLTAAPVPTVLLGFLWPWMWGISSWLLAPEPRSAAQPPGVISPL